MKVCCNLLHLNCKSATSLLQVFLAIWKEVNVGYVSLCALLGWVNRLQDLNVAFKVKQNERDTEQANKTTGNVKAVRVEIDPLYETMVERVNALVSLNMQTTEIENFILELNQKIKTLETTLAVREGRKEMPSASAN